MSLMFAGVPFGIGLASPLTQLLIDAAGWRVAWLVLGAAGGLTVATVSIMFVRNRPEDLGLLPDGEVISEDPTGPSVQSKLELSWTARDAVRTGAFWRISLAYGLLMTTMGATGIFWVSFLRSLGVAPQVAALAFSTQAFTQVAASAMLMPLINRVQPRYLAMFGFINITGAMLVAANASTAWHGFAGALLGGLGIGSAMLMQTHIWPSYFGREHIGAIRGAATPVTLAMTGLGTPVLGILFDTSGYATGWLVAGCGLVIGLVLLLLSPKPIPR
jgi:predicted MFS family arabinose efflux permease